MEIHIGKIIQETVKNKGLKVTDFASKINYSRRNVYEIFDRETIDTGLLIKISKVLEQNLFVYFVHDIQLNFKKDEKKNQNILQLLEEIKKSIDELKNFNERINY